MLHLPDVGLGYITASADTQKIPLAEEMKNESPTAKTAERAARQGGYSAIAVLLVFDRHATAKRISSSPSIRTAASAARG